MRLLNTRTFTLNTFYDDSIPPYTILSHTWSSNEPTFQDILNIHHARTARGFQKIFDCCSRSLQDGYEWTWCDTVCIDKTSSSELSEAINSMWKWYSGSEICYVFLEDVDCRCNREVEGEKGCAVFQKSRWFTRGWTLQELIAPPIVEFYSGQWEEMGTKLSLSTIIAEITGVNVDVLKGLYVGNRCIAERMSWASNRRTTRSEDRAYSLMGIFDVNMPMLYGEGGEKAFLRLQEHIMKESEDYTLFAWTQQTSESPRGLLAHSPDEFSRENAAMYSGLEVNPMIEYDYLGIRPSPTEANETASDPVKSITSVTRREIHLNLAVRKYDKGILAYLDCRRKKDKHMLCIYLEHDWFNRQNRYARVQPNSVTFDAPEVIKNIRPSKSSTPETPADKGFYSFTELIVKDPTIKPWRQLPTKTNYSKHDFSIQLQSFDESIIQLGRLISLDEPMQPIGGMFLKLRGIVEVKRESIVVFLVLYGTTIAVRSTPWCHIETEDLNPESSFSRRRYMRTVTDRARKEVGDNFLATTSIRKQQMEAGEVEHGEKLSSNDNPGITYLLNISVSEKGRDTRFEANTSMTGNFF